MIARLLGLPFLSVQTVIPRFSFISYRYVCYVLMFMLFGWLQVVILNVLKTAYFLLVRLFKNLIFNYYIRQSLGGAFSIRSYETIPSPWKKGMYCVSKSSTQNKRASRSASPVTVRALLQIFEL